MLEFPWPLFLFLAAGLWMLFMPRWMMLFGDRWTLKNGDEAEPSTLYVIYTRLFGGIMVIATVIFGGSIISHNLEEQDQERFAATWGYDPDEVKNLDDLEVYSRLKPRPSLQLDDDERSVEISAYAIVGDNKHGPVLTPEFASEGDLILEVQAGSCQFRSIYLREESDSISVDVAVEEPQESDIPMPPGLNSVEPETWTCLPSDGSWDTWSSFSTPVRPILLVVNLDRPLGKRTVVSAADGNTLTPVTIRDAPAA